MSRPARILKGSRAPARIIYRFVVNRRHATDYPRPCRSFLRSEKPPRTTVNIARRGFHVGRAFSNRRALDREPGIVRVSHRKRKEPRDVSFQSQRSSGAGAARQWGQRRKKMGVDSPRTTKHPLRNDRGRGATFRLSDKGRSQVAGREGSLKRGVVRVKDRKASGRTRKIEGETVPIRTHAYMAVRTRQGGR